MLRLMSRSAPAVTSLPSHSKRFYAALASQHKQPTYEDVAGCQAAALEWAESFDTKDWKRLLNAVSPTLYLDYRTVIGQIWESMPADQFVGMVSNENFLGNKRIKTQHFIGMSKWTQVADGEIVGLHQMRVAHQKYKHEDLSEVLYQGHAHGNAVINYNRVDGVWKFAGLTPGIRWSEHDYDQIFKHD